ncbi:MAG: ABC transporter permease subunit [bacterium]|nr:ABC transporter permease subunit [bacterium]
MARLLTEKTKDRIAAIIIRGGGGFVILVVVAIVANIALQALPLFYPASAGQLQIQEAAPNAVLVGADSRQEVRWQMTRSGEVVFSSPDIAPIRVLDEGAVVAAADLEMQGFVTVLSTEGDLVVGRLRFRDNWQDGQRSISVRWRSAADVLQLGADSSWAGATASMDDDGNLLAVIWTEDGSVIVAGWSSDDEEWQRAKEMQRGALRSAAVASDLRTIAMVGRDGRLHVMRMPTQTDLQVEGVESNVTAARFLIGGGTLVIGAEDGSVQVLLQVPYVELRNGGREAVKVSGQVIQPGQSAVVLDSDLASLGRNPDIEVASADPRVRVVRSLKSMPATVSCIGSSWRRRGFLVGADDGSVGLYYATSGRRLLVDSWSNRPIEALTLAPKSDGGLAIAGGQVLWRSFDNPHPEISLRTLLLPVWYEGYAAPKWVWQSTGGSDAFEPKLSLWPLLFGTLKATLYAMLISVPLALMAAIYVSQLASSWLQNTVKPILELMAAVPSVVVGFLAAIWLAPRLEASLFPALMGFASLPLAVVMAVSLWRVLPTSVRSRMPEGGELLLLIACSVAVIWTASALARPIEGWLFNGDFQRFLFTKLGFRYDQRNSMVVGLALGFAVIPVIFTIAEDACSAVPKSLIAASRSLGATRWQTAVRMVVPAASPGLFAAIMLGFGRAVGETMIVLMAAGNTPLLDLSPFNGMRTMSAAIAVEIPEAPVGGTLFRVLFLTGALLFMFTLLLTTGADLVGRYLREKYGRF